MFMWDWFTGMLNYLGKFRAENNFDKITIFFIAQMQWMVAVYTLFVIVAISEIHLKLTMYNVYSVLYMAFLN